MNITALARRLGITTDELRVLLPKLGFDIGKRAIKVADQAAHKIIREWPRMLQRLREQEGPEEKGEEKLEEAQKEKRVLSLPSSIAVRELASKLSVPVVKLMQQLIKDGILLSINEQLDFETAAIVAEEFGFQVLREKKEKKLEEAVSPLVLEETEKGKFQPRPPVVVVMGHVDHGKSKLLEAIRKVEMLKHEAGGITQHIGAYQVEKNGKRTTFLDTPGHEAFVAMRSRGARVADIAILVVAADDGVQPQTIEAVNIIQAAKLPFLVAINKIDKPDADPERVKRQLSELGLVPEEWGGKTVCMPLSAKTGQGINELLDTLLLIADLEKDRLMAAVSRQAVGTVIESRRDSKEGNIVTLLVQAGTLNLNDALSVRGIFYGKVRAMRDFQGLALSQAFPSQPVKIIGFKVLPEIGTLIEVKEEKELVREKVKETVHIVRKEKKEETTKPALRVFLKADVLGSLEAIMGELEKFKTKEVELVIIDQGFGNIRESDVVKAKSREASIFGFNVAIEPDATKAAADGGVVVFTSPVIYELLDVIKKNVEDILPPLTKEIFLGKLVILKIFRSHGQEIIAGGKVQDGEAAPNTKTKIKRQGKIIGNGEVKELQKGEERISRASVGQEIGLKLSTSVALQEGDTLEIYREEKQKQTLNLPA